MRLKLLGCLVPVLLAGEAGAADPAKAEAAESKAVELEQNVALEKKKTPAPASKVITRHEAQSVDPEGRKPLDDPITCLSRTIYWEAKGEGTAGMEAIDVRELLRPQPIRH